MRRLRILVIVPAVVALAACGGSGKQSATPPTTAPATTTTALAPGALLPEAVSAATGDIPDNQVFLAFRNAQAGYSIKYPEGWAQRGSGRVVTFRDKNNAVRIVVAKGAATPASIRRDLAALSGAHVQSGPRPTTVPGAFKVVYTTRSAPNPVTGKRVVLTVDRYYLSHAGRLAVVDLGTPVGVDNVDAYRLMIESFRWR